MAILFILLLSINVSKYFIFSLLVGEYANITLTNENLTYDNDSSTYYLTMESGSSFNISYSISSNVSYVLTFGLNDSSYSSFINVDDEGTPSQKNVSIENGILKSYLVDYKNSKIMNHPVTGSGRRQSYKYSPTSRMTNTFFAPGKDDLEDMIASIKHGYMLFETNNGMEDPKNWQIQCTAEYGIEIVDGKLTDNYVSPVVMSGSVPELLKSISMVSDDFKIIGSGSCGKGYKEWVRVSDGGPALKVRVKLA